jgi:sterol desaturase/sphingolipid hydroxylase (fatty acid hydroxylase superfamily)
MGPPVTLVLIAAMAALALTMASLDVAGLLGLGPEAGATATLLVGPLLFYPLIAWLERRRPFDPSWNRSHGDVATDVLHLVVNGTVPGSLMRMLLVPLLVVGAGAVASRTGGGLWPAAWPLAAQLALALVIAELGHYAFHRLTHESPLFWRLHAAHHSAERLYFLNATRFHPLDLLGLLVCQTGPLVLLGITPQAFVAYAVFTSVYGQLQHCNVAMTGPRWVDWLFSTHVVHRWHHSPDVVEGNANYGAVLNVWDHLFGTYRFSPGRPFHRRIGIGDMPDFPRDYWGQVLAPWRWSRLPRTSS